MQISDPGFPFVFLFLRQSCAHHIMSAPFCATGRSILATASMTLHTYPDAHGDPEGGRHAVRKINQCIAAKYSNSTNTMKPIIYNGPTLPNTNVTITSSSPRPPSPPTTHTTPRTAAVLDHPILFHAERSHHHAVRHAHLFWHVRQQPGARRVRG